MSEWYFQNKTLVLDRFLSHKGKLHRGEGKKSVSRETRGHALKQNYSRTQTYLTLSPGLVSEKKHFFILI